MTATSLEPHAGSFMVLYGATTGRDGIGGVSVLASATLDDASEDVAAERADRRSVRREAADRGLARADRAAGCSKGCRTSAAPGITCAVSESAARAGMGARLDLDAVPLREPGMEAFEILTSESQERMLAIVHPSKLDGRAAPSASAGACARR